MPSGLVINSLGRATGRVPGLRRVPVVRLIAVADLGMLARDHYLRLSPYERRRLLALVRAAKGRPSSLRPSERDELAELVAKLEPRFLAGEAVGRLSPVPLPRRLLHGPDRSRRSAHKRAA
jgi:hypothetical protein